MKFSIDNLIASSYRKINKANFSGDQVFQKMYWSMTYGPAKIGYQLIVEYFDTSKFPQFHLHAGPLELFSAKAYYQTDKGVNIIIEYQIPGGGPETSIEDMEAFFNEAYIKMGFVEYV